MPRPLHGVALTAGLKHSRSPGASSERHVIKALLTSAAPRRRPYETGGPCMSVFGNRFNRIGRPALLAAVSVFALAHGGLAQAAEAALAADASTGAEVGLEEVIVTAEKRQTNLQETAIAISVLGANQIEDRHIQSLLDLGDGAIPSLRVAPFFSRGSALVMNVRGVGVLSDSNQPARPCHVHQK